MKNCRNCYYYSGNADKGRCMLEPPSVVVMEAVSVRPEVKAGDRCRHWVGRSRDEL